MILSNKPSLSHLKALLFKTLIVLCLSFIGNNVMAQSRSNQFIAYKDFFFLNSSTNFNYDDYDPSFLNDYGYSLVYQKPKGERKYRQYELKYAGVNSTNLETELKRVEVQLGYRRGKYWKPLSKNIRPRYSFAARMYYISEDIEPLTTSNFPINKDGYGIGFDYQIGLDIKLFKGLNILIDCSLATLNFGFDNQITKNPTLTPRQQEQGGYDFDLGLQRVLKIGIAIDL